MNAAPAAYASANWPSELARPFDPLENRDIARAMSILTGPDLGRCPPLTVDQARDVLRWAEAPRAVARVPLRARVSRVFRLGVRA